jgi:non-ribosomal peptide synthetase component E (peptide arylation enzyme)
MRKELLSLNRWATGVHGHKQDQINFYCEKLGTEEFENLPLSHPPV